MVKKLVPPPLKAPAKTAIRRWSNLLSSISRHSSYIKAKAWEQAGLACLFPKLRRPFNPIFRHIRCRLGLFEDEFMEVPSYNQISCSDSEIEEKEISMEKQIPHLKIINLQVRTKDDCFPDKPKVMFGARILIKLMDDLPCNDPKFKSSCQELFEQNQVIFTEDCVDARCRGNNDDSFRPCFECHTTDPRKSFGWGGNNPAWSILQQRYEGDRFRATKRKSRIICSKTAKSGHSCRIRTSRAIELRATSYIRVLQFIQKEQYLTKQDIDIFQYFQSYIP